MLPPCCEAEPCSAPGTHAPPIPEESPKARDCPDEAPDKGRWRRSPGCSAPTKSASNPGCKVRTIKDKPPNGGGAGVRIALFSRHLQRPRSGAQSKLFDSRSPGFPSVTLRYGCGARFRGLKKAEHRPCPGFREFGPVPALDRQAWLASTRRKHGLRNPRKNSPPPRRFLESLWR